MKKILALALLFGSIAMAGAAPGLVLSGVERYQVVAPQWVSYRPSIRCEGTIRSGGAYDLTVSAGYQVKERYASIGDRVEEGELLALLERAEGGALWTQTQGRGFGGEESGELEALMESYGLSSGAGSAAGAILQSLGGGEGEELLPVTAPVTGVLTREIPQPGTLVQAGNPVCSVEDREGCYALLTVGDGDAGEISPGDEVTLAGEGVSSGSWTGRVSRVYPGTRRELSGTAAQQVVDVEVVLEAGEGELRPGYTVKAEIFTDTQRQLMVLPYESVGQDESNREYALVAGEGTLEKRYITTGVELGDGVEVASGLEEGELVAVPRDGSAGEPGRYLLEGG